ncbi:uncharacterized protein LOC141667437 isoform X2 [Apium graveolens]|uniref:uncharacterized protein LOC141667437 isoform X2 n=1 Tax=Apium graveolens TaxID=4045 RepID=UPI003D7B5238
MVANQKPTPGCPNKLKAVIYQKIGPQRAGNYFNLLSRFLSLKLNKFPLLRAKSTAGVASHNVEVANGLPVNRSMVNRDPKLYDLPGPLDQQWKSQPSEAGQLSLGSRLPIFALVEDGEEVKQADGSPGIESKNPDTAPLGISIYNGAGKSPSSGTEQKFHPLTCQRTRELPDTRSLMILLEQNLEMKGLKISADWANVLNYGLDCYLKKLIEPCIGSAGSRLMTERPQHIIGQRIISLNKMLPASGIFSPKSSNSISASLSDLGVVVESKPLHTWK